MIEFLETLIFLSIAGTACGLILIALRKLCRGRIPNTFLYFAWLVVVLRFALPVGGLIPVDRSDVVPTRNSYTEPLPAGHGDAEITEESSYVQAEYPHEQVQSESVLKHTERNEAESETKAVSLPEILFIVWCCGTAASLACNVIPYIRFASALKKSMKNPSCSDVEIYDEICPLKRPELARSRAIAAPMTFGLFRPVLVLPDAEYEPSELSGIFAHELIHFKRRDILFKWLELIVYSAHFFNPFVYLFRKETDRVCELSCDEMLLKRMDSQQKRSYGETLLTIAENAGKGQCRMATGFSEGKRDLKERLTQIMSFKKKSRLALIIAAAVIFAFCGSALALGPKAEKADGAKADAAKVVNVSDVDELLAAIAPDTEIHLAPGTYNLTKASDYGRAGSGRNYQWFSYGFENQFELQITGIEGLSIIGDDAEILTVPRSSNVLSFRNCDRLTLSGLTVGHTEAAQKCEGGVIRLEACNDGVIVDCRLYGCGTTGVWAEQSSNLKVTGTEIYHCSSAGISFSEATGLTAVDDSIYDCGESGTYLEAAGAFLFFNAGEVTVRNCEIYGNHLRTLIQGYAEGASFDGLNVHDNHVNTAFCFEGDAKFKDFTFSGNTVDRWTESMYQTGAITIDGKKCGEDELSEMWGEQLSSSGIGAAVAEYLTIDREGTREVHVSTADEFIAAIASDTTIFIDAPQIDLTDCSDYGAGASAEMQIPDFGDSNYTWNYCYDGYELCIGNVSNFHIVGGEIITQPRYANVLNWRNCSDVTLENVRLGHSPEPGQCMGGVLYFDKSRDIIIESCDLYGCGILGLNTRDVSNIHVQNTLIHDCSCGAAVLEGTDSAVFLGCSVVNCPEPHFSLYGCNDFIWDNRLMDPYSSFNVNDTADKA